MLGLFIVTVLAADVGALIEAEAYEQAYARIRPEGLEGAAWIGFLYEAELLDVVRFGRAAEGLKKYKQCRMAFAAAAQRERLLHTELLARALSCAQKGKERDVIGLLAGQLLKTSEQDRALIALATLEKGEKAGVARQKLVERCASRWCRAKLLAMASDALKGDARNRVDQTLVQSFSDLSAGRTAFGRLQKKIKRRKDRNKLHLYLPKES